MQALDPPLSRRRLSHPRENTRTPLHITRLEPGIGAEIARIDLRQPLSTALPDELPTAWAHEWPFHLGPQRLAKCN